MKTEKTLTVEACPSHEMLVMLGNKWTVLCMGVLHLSPANRARFSQIRDALPGISQRMLTQTLRQLERNGLVIRHYFPTIPPRVEYEISEVGKEMLQALTAYTDWAKARWPDIAQAREGFSESREATGAQG